MSLRYPQSKEVAGAHYWNVLHNIAATYPENPNEQDKIINKNVIEGIVNRFVCPDCSNNASEYLKNNPMPMDNRKSLSSYLCKMHNTKNKELGKPEIDCDEITGGQCSTCDIKTVAEDGSKVDEVANVANVEMYKTAVTNFISTECSKYGIPLPKIIFGECPTNNTTSCVIYDKSKINPATSTLEDDATIYINPYSASLRTVYHEFKHYLDLKNKSAHSLSEVESDRFAFSKLDSMFKKDETLNIITNPNIMSANDGGGGGGNSRQEPINKLTLEGYSVKDWKNRYPATRKLMENYTKLKKHKAKNWLSFVDENGQNILGAAHDEYGGEANDYVMQDQPQPQQLPDRAQILEASEGGGSGGLLKGLDSLFEFPASMVGISTKEFNMAYTPELISNIYSLALHSYMNNFGASLTIFSTAMITFGLGVGFRKTLAHYDKLLLQNISGSLLIHMFNFINPKVRDDLVNSAGMFLDAIKAWDWDKVKDSIFNNNSIEGLEDQDAMLDMKGMMDSALAGNAGTVRDAQGASQRTYDAASPIGRSSGGGGANDLQARFNSGRRFNSTSNIRDFSGLENSGRSPFTIQNIENFGRGSGIDYYSGDYQPLL